MSNDSSTSQPVPRALGGLVAVPAQDPGATSPCGAKTTWKLDGVIATNPNCFEKYCRSAYAFGSSKASTMAMALPPPDGFEVTTLGLQPGTAGCRLYMQAMEAGVW